MENENKKPKVIIIGEPKPDAKKLAEQCFLHGVGRSYSRSEVKNIVLEIENAAKHALSHNLDRREMVSAFCSIRKKWDLFG